MKSPKALTPEARAEAADPAPAKQRSSSSNGSSSTSSPSLAGGLDPSRHLFSFKFDSSSTDGRLSSLSFTPSTKKTYPTYALHNAWVYEGEKLTVNPDNVTEPSLEDILKDIADLYPNAKIAVLIQVQGEFE